jgi:opacity protein-like surface antigen
MASSARMNSARLDSRRGMRGRWPRGNSAAILGSAALALSLCSVATSAHAQANCTASGPLGAAAAIFPLAGSTTATANSIVSTISNIDTAFLAQGSAFVGSPKSDTADFTAGGAWVRGIGGRVDTNSTGTVANVAIAGAPLPGNVVCNTSVHQTYAGVQVGQDIGKLNLGGTGENVHFGVTAGYVGSSATDTNGGSGSIQAPFIGFYSVLTYGNFFADFLTRFNSIESSITASAIGINNQNLDARGISFSASGGYRFDLGNNWFVEPSVALISSTVKVDTLHISGNGSGVIVPPGFFQFNDIQSTLGRAGVRVGTSFVSGNLSLQPFATASVWHEFEGDATGTFSTCVIPCGAIPLTGTLNSTRIGTYGQYSAGIAAQVVDTGWLSYVRVDYKKGDNIDALGVNGGLRYEFDPLKALRAAPGIYKAPKKAPVYKAAAAEPPYSWTGFHVGGFVGADSGATTVRFPNVESLPRIAGILAGGEAGYDYQIGPWVLGLAGDAAWTNSNGAENCITFNFTCHSNVNTLATGTGRIGLAWDRVLFYAKGGVAWENGSVSYTCNAIGCASQSASQSRTGWTAGAGVEFGLARDWSAKAEYDYLDFGNQTGVILAPFVVQFRESINEAKIGVNYRFGPMPVVARN